MVAGLWRFYCFLYIVFVNTKYNSWAGSVEVFAGVGTTVAQGHEKGLSVAFRCGLCGRCVTLFRVLRGKPIVLGKNWLSPLCAEPGLWGGDQQNEPLATLATTATLRSPIQSPRDGEPKPGQLFFLSPFRLCVIKPSALFHRLLCKRTRCSLWALWFNLVAIPHPPQQHHHIDIPSILFILSLGFQIELSRPSFRQSTFKNCYI